MLGVVRAVEERDGARPIGLRDGSPGIRPGLQFGGVARAELLPAGRVVAEPASELRAWRHLLEPRIEHQCGFADAARPKALYQEARAVLRIVGLIHAFERNHLVLLS